MISKATIQDDSYVSDIVSEDYRTSYVFKKYNIDYCCGGKLPLRTVCELRGLATEEIKKELEKTMRIIQISSSTNFNSWSIDFLIDYIINVHHSYLTGCLPEIIDTVEQFVIAHLSKYSYLSELQTCLYALRDGLLPYIEKENQIVFPYIKQIAHAYESHEPYAGLLVRTLRKPVENLMNHEHEDVRRYLHKFRELTNYYTPPASACLTHKVALSKLKELDENLVQHIHLENNILFPKAISMEKELLEGIHSND
jgi:regulator of cell morphogenesis and NO signaling